MVDKEVQKYVKEHFNMYAFFAGAMLTSGLILDWFSVPKWIVVLVASFIGITVLQVWERKYIKPLEREDEKERNK